MHGNARASGLLFRMQAGERRFLGTTFLFRRQTHVLTAAHCVRDVPIDELEVWLNKRSFAVATVQPHPNADIVVLEILGAESLSVRPLSGPEPLSPFGWGSEIISLGYPEDADSDDEYRPTPRLFKGHVQRFFRHRSRLPGGYDYQAGELSVGAPAGLSGGAVIPSNDPLAAVGVVTENRQSTTYLASIEEVVDDGHSYKESIHHMIQYGVFVDLRPLADWLDEHVPKPSGHAPRSNE